MTIRASSGVFGWMQDCGVRFQPSLTGTLNLGRTNAFFLGGGKALVNAYYLTAERLGVDIIYDTEVVGLNMEDGFVRSADITHRGFPETVSRLTDWTDGDSPSPTLPGFGTRASAADTAASWLLLPPPKPNKPAMNPTMAPVRPNTIKT